MLDLLILPVPPLTPTSPPLGPSLVLAAAKRAGFSARQFDLNIDLRKRFTNDVRLLRWMNMDSTGKKLRSKLDKILDPAIEDWIDLILSENPRWIGFSLLTHRCSSILKKMLPLVRKAYPAGKIVLGGGAVFKSGFGPLELDQGLIDAYVTTEGEVAIVELLRGNMDAPNINGRAPQPIADLNALPAADYSDLQIEDYGKGSMRSVIHHETSQNAFFIEGSRGCVRKCSFCDVPFSKPGYRYRSPGSIISEALTLREKYGARRIDFADSLVNASPPNLRALCQSWIEHFSGPSNKGEKELSWQGYFIIRPPSQTTPEDFDLYARSGCIRLAFGIESGSESVRLQMNKKIRDEDIDYNIRQAKKVGIDVNLLMMTGYPTETQSDFQQSIDLLSRHRGILRLTDFLQCSWRVGILGFESDLNLNSARWKINYDLHGEWYTDHVNVLISAKRYFKLVEHAKLIGMGAKRKVGNARIKKRLALYGIGLEDLRKNESELESIYRQTIQQEHSDLGLRVKS